MKDVLHKFLMRLPAMVLLLATFLFWEFYDRYEPAGPALVEYPDLGDADRIRGDCSHTNGQFMLVVPDGGKTAAVSFRLPEITRYDTVRVKGRIRTESVVVGKYAWRCARILLTQYKNNKWLPGDHSLIMQSGTTEWVMQADEFEVMPDAEYGMLQIQHVGLSGTAWFDQLVAEPVQIKTSYFWFRTLFILLWLFMVPLYFKRCRLNRRKLRVLILLNTLAILAGSIMPSDWIKEFAEGAKKTYVKVVPKPAREQPAIEPKEETPVKKEVAVIHQMDELNLVVGSAHGAGHFLLFASLCFLVYLSAALERQHAVYFFKVAIDILLFAAITESLQYLTHDRTPGIHDWLIDVYGMFTALILFLLLFPGIRWVRDRLKAR